MITQRSENSENRSDSSEEDTEAKAGEVDQAYLPPEVAEKFLPLMEKLSKMYSELQEHTNPLYYLRAALAGLKTAYMKYPLEHPDFYSLAGECIRESILEQISHEKPKGRTELLPQLMMEEEGVKERLPQEWPLRLREKRQIISFVKKEIVSPKSSLLEEIEKYVVKRYFLDADRPSFDVIAKELDIQLDEVEGIYESALTKLRKVSKKVIEIMARQAVEARRLPFPMYKQKNAWRIILKEALNSAGLLNEKGKIKDLDTLLSINNKFFISRKGKMSPNVIYGAYQRAMRRGAIQLPKGSYLHHFILKHLGFVSHKLWMRYLEYQTQKKPFPSDEQRVIWEFVLREALSKAHKLNAQGEIKSLKTLLGIESYFFTDKKGKNAPYGMYQAYRKAITQGRIPIESNVLIQHLILKNLRFVGKKLWQKYLNRDKTIRRRWKSLLTRHLRDAAKLEKGKIKDYETLLSITYDFFAERIGRKGIMHIYTAYQRDIQSGGRVLSKGVSIPLFILRDLGFITNKLWKERTAPLFISPKRRESWINNIREALTGKLNEQGQVIDLNTLLSIDAEFFTSKKGEDSPNAAYQVYKKAIEDGHKKLPEGAFIHHFLLKELGFVSAELWDEYLTYQTSERTFLSEHPEGEWKGAVKGVLQRLKKLDREGKVKDLKTLLSITGISGKGVFERNKKLRLIYEAYYRAQKGKRIQVDENALLHHYLLRDLGFVSDEVWAEYLAYRAGPRIYLPGEKEEYQVKFKRKLQKQKKLNQKGKIKNLETLLSISDTCFKLRKKRYMLIYSKYALAFRQNRLKRQSGSTIHHFILYDLGFIDDELWQEYLEYQNCPSPVLYEKTRKEWKRKLTGQLKKAHKLNKEGKIKGLVELLTIEDSFFKESKGKEGLYPIYWAYCKALADGHIKKHKEVTIQHFILYHLGFIPDELWNLYLKYQQNPAPVLYEEFKAEWKINLKRELRKAGKLNRKGEIKSLEALLSMAAFFESHMKQPDMRYIFNVYKYALDKDDIELPESAGFCSFIVYHLGFVPDAVWDDYLEYKSLPTAVLSKRMRKEWREKLEPLLRSAKKLNKEGKIKDIETLLSIQSTFFVSAEVKDEIRHIYTVYRHAIAKGHIKKPESSAIHRFILYHLGFVEDGLWRKLYPETSSEPSPPNAAKPPLVEKHGGGAGGGAPGQAEASLEATSNVSDNEDGFVNPDLRGWQDGSQRQAGLRQKISDAIKTQSHILNIILEILGYPYPGLYKNDLDGLSKNPEPAIAKYAKITLAAGEAINWGLFFRRERPDTGFLTLYERKRLTAAIALVCTGWMRAKAAKILHINPIVAGRWIKNFGLQEPPKDKREYIELTQTEKNELGRERIEKATYAEAVKRFGKIVAVISSQVGEEEATTRKKLIKYGHIEVGKRAKIVKSAQARLEKVAGIVEEMYDEAKNKTEGPIIITTGSVAEKLRERYKQQYKGISNQEVSRDLWVLRKRGRFSSYPGLRFKERHRKERGVAEQPLTSEERAAAVPLIPRLALDMSVSELESVIELAINEYGRNEALNTAQKDEIYKMIRNLEMYDRPKAASLRQRLDAVVGGETGKSAPEPGRKDRFPNCSGK